MLIDVHSLWLWYRGGLQESEARIIARTEDQRLMAWTKGVTAEI